MYDRAVSSGPAPDFCPIFGQSGPKRGFSSHERAIFEPKETSEAVSPDVISSHTHTPPYTHTFGLTLSLSFLGNASSPVDGGVAPLALFPAAVYLRAGDGWFYTDCPMTISCRNAFQRLSRSGVCCQRASEERCLLMEPPPTLSGSLQLQ